LKSNPQLLSNHFLKPDSAKQQRSTLGGYSPVYVKKWVDYSSKYGLGYLLSDGSTGIYFNDASKMVLDDLAQKVDYISNEGEDKRLVCFALSSSPDDKEISKKLTLMQYFRKYLHGSAS
jgi:polo-like kinase 1